MAPCYTKKSSRTEAQVTSLDSASANMGGGRGGTKREGSGILKAVSELKESREGSLKYKNYGTGSRLYT